MMANEPITREEMLLNAVATGVSSGIEPVTREEMFLAKAAGMNVEAPEPITRREMFLSKISGGGGAGGSGSGDEWIGDGNTHIWISLKEGRTSPMLGCVPNGTVTVDWGDGTEPDTLTGTSTNSIKWTPTHEYAAPGDYVITLTVDGVVGFSGSTSSGTGSCTLRYASGADRRNRVYQNAMQKMEIGNGVTSISGSAFAYCTSLSSIVIPAGVTSISGSAFANCTSLSSIVIPAGVTSISGSAFANCPSLSSIVIPDSVISISDRAFQGCTSLSSIVIPAGVTSIGSYAFFNCPSLSSIVIPAGVTSISGSAFANCTSLSSIVIPAGVTSIGGNAFNGCTSMGYYDFTAISGVPTLESTDAFNGIPADCKMLVPATLYDEWSTATNWATYASYMVAV